MHRTGRIGALFCAAAAAGATVLLSPLTPAAEAAPGSFTYTGGDGKPRTSSNPPFGRCVPLVGSGPVKNMTESRLNLYDGPSCEPRSRIAKVDPMSIMDDVPTFQAVFWGDD